MKRGCKGDFKINLFISSEKRQFLKTITHQFPSMKKVDFRNTL